MLAHSIENIYIQAGQFDRFSIFEFYPRSEAYQKYGKEVYGIIYYKPIMRKKMEEILLLTLEEMPNSDGQIYLDGAMPDSEVNSTLLKDGFLASDVMHLKCMDHGPIQKVYGKSDDKQIPNTITVPIRASSYSREDLLFLQRKLLKARLDSIPPLIPEELRKYYTLEYILNPNVLSAEIIERYLKDEAGENFSPDVEILILENKLEASFASGQLLITTQEYLRLRTLLSSRRLKRLAIIKKQLGICDKQINDFKNSNKEEYDELMTVILRFESETLIPFGAKYALYWDFDRFIHIMLRHYKSFYIDASTKRPGTNFQYIYKDILRLIKIVLEENLKDIELAISEGKEFRRYQDEGFYYNGNYYTFRVAKDGKLMQFHPQD